MRLVAVTSCQWWWRRSLGVLGESLGEEEEEENGYFTLLDVFVACNTRPGEFGSLGQADPAQIFLLQ